MRKNRQGRKPILATVQRRYQRTEPERSYLKYFRVVRMWASAKYDITLADLELMFFLHDEGLFDYYTYIEYTQVFGWQRDRMKKLIERELIHFWGRSEKGIKLYEVTYKTRRIMDSIYKKLELREEFAESKRRNPFAGRVRYRDKVYMNMIETFNKEVRAKKAKTPR